MSTTAVETWSGTDLTTLGPIYPFVGTEFILVMVGVGCWIAFHIFQGIIESNQLYRDDQAAKDHVRRALGE